VKEGSREFEQIHDVAQFKVFFAGSFSHDTRRNALGARASTSASMISRPTRWLKAPGKERRGSDTAGAELIPAGAPSTRKPRAMPLMLVKSGAGAPSS